MLSGTQSSERTWTLKDGGEVTSATTAFSSSSSSSSSFEPRRSRHCACEPVDREQTIRLLSNSCSLLGHRLNPAEINVTRCLNPVLLFSVSLGTRWYNRSVAQWCLKEILWIMPHFCNCYRKLTEYEKCTKRNSLFLLLLLTFEYKEREILQFVIIVHI